MCRDDKTLKKVRRNEIKMNGDDEEQVMLIYWLLRQFFFFFCKYYNDI